MIPVDCLHMKNEAQKGLKLRDTAKVTHRKYFAFTKNNNIDAVYSCKLFHVPASLEETLSLFINSMFANSAC